MLRPANVLRKLRWWEELTARGGEGIVVKPMDFIARGRRGLAQPAVKCRGQEYLRLIYGPEAWIDIWTSQSVPESAQLKGLVDGFVRGVAPKTANALRSVPGTPIYVEMNFEHYKKTPLVWIKSFDADDAGEDKALRVGRFYFKVPLLDALLK